MSNRISYAFYQTPWGRGLTADSGGKIVRIYLPWADEDSLVRQLSEDLNSVDLTEGSDISQQMVDELESYFINKTTEFRTPVDLGQLTPFQQKVALATSGIPFGEVRTYKWLAEQAGSPLAFRAAGQVMRTNRFPLVIPCHRVLGSGGSLGGFACGLEWKLRLLDHEGIQF